MLTERKLSYKIMNCEKKGSFISIYLDFVAVLTVFSYTNKKLEQIVYLCSIGYKTNKYNTAINPLGR